MLHGKVLTTYFVAVFRCEHRPYSTLTTVDSRDIYTQNYVLRQIKI